MKLIKELLEEVTFLTEGTGADKKYFVEGIFIQGDIVNRNKRRYPMDVLRPDVERYVREYVGAKRAFGELGHPTGPTINLDRVSHMITELKEDGKNFVGRAKIMDTPMGKIVKTLLDEGAKIGMSTRALGSLKLMEGGINEVQKDFYLATAGDIVADPSAPEAFVQGVMEGAEWLVDVRTGEWTYKTLDETKELIQNARSHQLEEMTLRAWKNFLDSI
jgi:hypothetical protein